MTRRTVELEIVKTDEKSSKTLVDVILALAFRSEHRWEGIGEDYGFRVDYDGELIFDFKRCYGIYDKNSARFESEEEMVWDNYAEDIQEVAKKYPQFEFYYHIVSEGVGYSDEVIYARGSHYSRKDNVVLSPKQMWEYKADKIKKWLESEVFENDKS